MEADPDFIEILGHLTNYISNERVRSYNEGVDAVTASTPPTEIRPPIHAAIPDGEVDEIRDTVRQAREYMKANSWNPNNRACELMTELCSCSEQAAARLTALEAENAALKAEVAEARAKAIEECAKVADKFVDPDWDFDVEDGSNGTARSIALAIRSLSTSGEQER